MPIGSDDVIPEYTFMDGLETLVVPVLIIDSQGNIQFSNAALRNLCGERATRSTSPKFIDLVADDDLLKISGIETVLEPLPNTFTVRIRASQNQTLPVSFTAQALKDSDSRLLIAHNNSEIMALASNTGKELSEAANEISNLEVRIFKQTAKLAAESAKRAQAEEKSRLEAENKVSLIRATIHHLNNPLNHIEGSRELITREIEELGRTIDSLLHTEPVDPETEAFRLKLREQFESSLFNVATIQDATSRITNTVDLLRVVSGVDGWSPRRTTIGDICEVGMNRLSGIIMIQLDRLKRDYGVCQVLGHPSLYAHAIDLIESALHQRKLTSSNLKVSQDEEHCHLIWESISPSQPAADGPDTQTLDLKADFEDTQKEIDYLLAHYKARFETRDFSLHLLLPRPSGT